MSVKLKKQKKTTISKTKTPTNQKSKEVPSEEKIEAADTVEKTATDDEKDSSITEKQVDDGTGLANESPVEDDDDDDEMDLAGLRKSDEVKLKKKRKKGIIYVSNIPKHMNVTRIREILGEFGKIGRVYLQPEKLPGGDDQKKEEEET